MPRTRKKSILAVLWLVLLAGLMFGVTHFSSSISGGDNAPPPPPPPDGAGLAKRWPEVLAHAAAPPRGNPNAPYTVAEFGDFQCPQCGRLRPLLEKVLSKYPQQADLIFVHRPFPRIHQWALPAARASEVAAKQGKFWPMYDILYSHQKDLEPGFYPGYAAQAGLDVAQFRAAYDTKQGVAEVNAASRFSDSLGVQETPTVLVRDNARGTVTAYVGLAAKDPAQIRPGDRYIDRDFLARPPWLSAPAAKTAQSGARPSRRG